jgi:hypothetical protein
MICALAGALISITKEEPTLANLEPERVFLDRTEAVKNGIWYLYEIVDMRCPVCHMRTNVAVSGPDFVRYAHRVGDEIRWHTIGTDKLPDDPKFWRFLFEIDEVAP